MGCSHRSVLLALVGLCCLLGQGFASVLPSRDNTDDEAQLVSLDQILLNASKLSVKDSSPFSFSEHTHLIRREFDMVYTLSEWLDIKHKNRQRRTAAIKPDRIEKRWKNNVVNFELEDGTFTTRDQIQIYRAVRELAHYTCLRFRETNSKPNRILIQEGFGGCYSRVGMVGGQQELGLGQGCRYKRIIIHELMHAIGVHHEQTRPDRDDHVTIRLDHIDDSMEYNFEKYNWDYINSFGQPYDYYSVMHYGNTAFTQTGEYTIVTKEKKYQKIIGTSPGLSYGDIRTLNSMHSCQPDESCPLKPADCDEVGGFLGKDCTCWCQGSHHFRNPVERCSQKDVDEKGSLSEVCKDFEPECPTWAASGYCDDDQYWAYMFTYCGKSCREC